MPSTTNDTSATATISSALAGTSVPDFDVVFSIVSNDCINPTLSVRYEAIDFTDGQADETFDVFDNDGSLITNCGGGGQCAAWQTCLGHLENECAKQHAESPCTLMCTLRVFDVFFVCTKRVLFQCQIHMCI